MKRKMKLLIGLAVACAGTLILGACSGAGPLEEMAKTHPVIVCFDVNGGTALSTNNEKVKIIDGYTLGQVQSGCKLLAPDDPARTGLSGTFNYQFNMLRSKYFCAGWYCERDYRSDAEGYLLDEDGNRLNDESGSPYTLEAYKELSSEDREHLELKSSTGKSEPGYTYGKPWNFETDLLNEQTLQERGVLEGSLADYTNPHGEVTLTLYAAWVPYFSFNLMGWVSHKETDAAGTERDVYGWEEVATYSFDASGMKNGDTVECALPYFDSELGGVNYGNFEMAPEYTMTFDKAYQSGDAEGNLSDPVSEDTLTFTYQDSIDMETATVTNARVDVYAEWRDGTWYQISRPEQLLADRVANSKYSYEIMNDLDFTDVGDWPVAFSSGEYTGTFRGGNHTITGIVVRQTDAEAAVGGIFGSLGASARIEDITFKAPTFRLEAGTRKAGGLFGLFAGSIASDDCIKNVKIESGVFFVSEGAQLPDNTMMTPDGPITTHNYDMGLVTGDFNKRGIEADVSVMGDVGVNVNADNTTGTVTFSKMSPSHSELRDRAGNYTGKVGETDTTVVIGENGRTTINAQAVNVYKYGTELRVSWNGKAWRLTVEGNTFTLTELADGTFTEVEDGEEYVFTKV